MIHRVSKNIFTNTNVNLYNLYKRVYVSEQIKIDKISKKMHFSNFSFNFYKYNLYVNSNTHFGHRLFTINNHYTLLSLLTYIYYLFTAIGFFPLFKKR